MSSKLADEPVSAPDQDLAPWPLRPTPRMLKKLAQLGELLCTPVEVAAMLGADQTQMVRFLDRGQPRAAFIAGRRQGQERLRGAQLKLAETHVNMAMFLGKTFLGQGEAQEADQSDAIDASQASQRVRDKLAAIAAEAAAEDDREGG